ncbi:hypothetical protein [Methanococcoides sp. NM1]|uniref:hypothetical protein n=1 Tax=Methanococcoides sp. NM1 TaxID=1201013 RepID=UPI001082858A|nr:hypothetical protein [Methanococcoides sp. NM1]
MSLSTIEQAIANKKTIEFFYDGAQRIVEPYLVGNTTTGKQSLRAYQIGGHSNSKVPSWKMFTIMKMTNIKEMENTFSKRPDYNPNDKAMTVILFRVE